eukprot:Nitzschia sp. Nitz4//scaffold50_size126154//119812//120807//NITZ4_003708-RA/size126154-processed-gene-0.48-mRNA-1//1//CDS//3329553767//8432//frame0
MNSVSKTLQRLSRTNLLAIRGGSLAANPVVVGSTQSWRLYSVVTASSSLPRPALAQQQRQQQQIRWRHAGKMGHMKETLDELAHQPEHEAAVERRNKKKGGKKKGKKGEEAAAAAVVDDSDDSDDDLDLDIDEEEAPEDGEDVEPSLPDPDEVKERMLMYVEKFQESLKSIRGAEPTPEMFDDVQVNAYGSQTPLKAVGQVVIVSPTLAQITCFDPSVAKDVAQAIQLALELNPQMEEGGSVKVPLPRVSMEIREQTAKQLKKKAEATKQRIRQVRRKAMDVVKKGKDGKLAGISKDDAFAVAKDIDSVTESVVQTLDGKVDEKMKSIMAV